MEPNKSFNISVSSPTDQVFIHETAKVSPTAILGPNVSIGENVIVEDGVRVKNSIVLKGALLKVSKCDKCVNHDFGFIINIKRHVYGRCWNHAELL